MTFTRNWNDLELERKIIFFLFFGCVSLKFHPHSHTLWWVSEWERAKNIFDEFLRNIFPPKSKSHRSKAGENIRLIDECDVSNLEFSFLWEKCFFSHDVDDDEKYLFLTINISLTLHSIFVKDLPKITLESSLFVLNGWMGVNWNWREGCRVRGQSEN
jgi:hypothetical protein